MRAAILCLLLAGCSLTPEVRIETVQVPVPIMVPCAVIPPAEPEWALKTVSPDSSTFDKARAFVATLSQLEGYIVQLKAASAGCVKGTK